MSSKVDFTMPSPSSSSTDYHRGEDAENDAVAFGQRDATDPPESLSRAPPSGVRRQNTTQEERNNVSLRFRADSIDDSIATDEERTAEGRVWSIVEMLFCFLRNMTIYQTRKYLKFIIVTQAVTNSIRIIPIILGLSYQAMLPVFMLYITLVLGWHGTNFLLPKFLLMYKVGMQLSLGVDLLWYALGYNGDLASVNEGTSVLMQGFFSVLLTLMNAAALLIGWKLRRLVKYVQSQREFSRPAFVTVMPPTPTPRTTSGRQRNTSVTPDMQPTPENSADDEDAEPPQRREIYVHTSEVSVPRPTSSSHSSSGSGSSKDEMAKLPPQNFVKNEICTSKYTFYNFPYVFLRMQFSRLANAYTTIIVILCFFSFSPVTPIASLTPLLIVFASSALKDVNEDLGRQRADRNVNEKSAHVVRREGKNNIQHIDATWQDIQVGDLLILKDGEDVPADCILLTSNRSDGRCYIETANLDGETNLKIRSVAKCTKAFMSAESILEKHDLYVECDAPNRDLFYFDGVLKLLGGEQKELEEGEEDENETSLTMDNLMLRGSETRNTEWAVGLVIYTGKETKVMLNSSDVPFKRSFVEKTLDTMFVLVLIMLFGIAAACTLGNNNWQWDVEDGGAPWYIVNADNGYIFLSYVILFNNLIPLSMYVTMEGVRFVHAQYIESDLEMYDKDTDTPAQARNSNINEDLGQIQYIFSDKTGTLTRNEMIFAKCTIGGLKYNDVEPEESKAPRPGTRFNDPRLLARLNSRHKTTQEIHDFLLLLAICNTVIPEYDDVASEEQLEGVDAAAHPIKYNASSPDEEALVQAAKDLGYVLTSRDGSKVEIVIQGKTQTFEILNVLEFNSDRKRMSIIFRHPDGRLQLFCKGADDMIFDRLSKSQPQGTSHLTRRHLQEYASEGLRTLTTSKKDLTEEEYQEWQKTYHEAELSMDGRAAKIAAAAELIEVELTLLGATAIEDCLQDGVEDAISSLRKAGINFWVLTGDKKETALSIGMSSQVIDDNMDVVVLGQTDKDSLRAKLEELYVDWVEDKFSATNEYSSATSVLWEAFKRTLSYAWYIGKTAVVGRDEHADPRKKRRRAHRRDEHVPETESTNSHTRFDEVFPGSANVDDARSDTTFERSHCDENFEPFNASNAYPKPLEESDLSEEEEIEYALVIDGKTLALVLEDDVKYLFLAIAIECKSVICCRCSPAQKASVVKLVTEPTLMFSPGNITLAIGDGANDVPMIQAANVGVGISGKEGRQAVLSSDYSFAQFKFLKRLLLVHGNYSYKRISKLILFSFMKNVALSFSNFFLAVQTMYSGLLMYFGLFFTLYNALFTTIPIVVIAMYNQDVSPAVLMQYPTLYVNGLRNRSFNWLSFFGWCGLGIWHAYVIYAIPFFSNGFVTYYFAVDTNNYLLFGADDLGLWACGVAAYTYLITSSTAQVALMTSNWTRANVYATLGTLVFYFVFLAFFGNIYGLTKTDIYETETAYGVLRQLLTTSWFWFGLLLSTVISVLPNYYAKAGRVLFYPEPSHLMREWNRMPKELEAGLGAATAEPTRLVRKNTGFAFSHTPGEYEMALSTHRSVSQIPRPTSSRASSPAGTPQSASTNTVIESSPSKTVM